MIGADNFESPGIVRIAFGAKIVSLGRFGAIFATKSVIRSSDVRLEWPRHPLVICASARPLEGYACEMVHRLRELSWTKRWATALIVFVTRSQSGATRDGFVLVRVL